MSIQSGREGPAFIKPAKSTSNIQYYHQFDRVHLAICKETLEKEDLSSNFEYFSIEGLIYYIGFADDFGPMNLGSIFQFCAVLDKELEQNRTQQIALLTPSDRRTVTNHVFLMGAYMIMKLNCELEIILQNFDSIMQLTLPFRDVSPGHQNFNLSVQDCWKGLIRAKKAGWVDFDEGVFDLEEYLHLDSPLNADLHEIVPGKFIAMRGPRDNTTAELWEDVMRDDGSFSHRDFSPKHYVDILRQFDVQVVVRLNTPQYRRETFSDAGIAVADLFFEDCTSPPVDVVAKFLAIAEAIPGALAVHCHAGLGRTGTLIALFMIKHHGFTAREAMGWLRIVRPGSVIGGQQDFLCAREALMRRSSAPLLPAEKAAPADFATVQRLVDGTILAYDLRYAVALGDSAAAAAQRDAAAEGRALAAHVSAAAMRRNGLRSARSTAM